MNIFDILVVNICIGSSVVYDVLVKQWITGETEIRIKFIIWDDYQVLGISSTISGSNHLQVQ